MPLKSLVAWRNLVIAALAGPVLTIVSIAVGVTDQGLDSVAGPVGFPVLIIATAIVSMAVFVAASIAMKLAVDVAKDRGICLSRQHIVLGLASLLALAFWLAFKLPTPKWQHWAMTLGAFITALVSIRVSPYKDVE